MVNIVAHEDDDLLIINKMDLAPFVGADLDVMRDVFATNNLGLAATFMLRMEQRWTNTVFWLLQTGFIAVTIYSISYTPYLLDISSTILFALCYYTITKVYAAIHLSAVRGNPVFSDFLQGHADKPFLLGAQPRTVDASAYAFLANILWAPVDSALRRHARTRPNLEAFCQRMKARCFPDPGSKVDAAAA